MSAGPERPRDQGSGTDEGRVRVMPGVGADASAAVHVNAPAERSAPFTVAVKAFQLRYQMRVRGLTGAELARRAGVSAATVSHALNGRRIRPEKLTAMAAALLGVEPVPGITELVDEAERAEQAG